MLKERKSTLARIVAKRILDVYEVEHDPVVETPPRRDLGDVAFPAPLHLARQVRKKPRDIAGALLEGLELPDWVREVRIEGAGFLNIFFVRNRFVADLLDAPVLESDPARNEKVIVEHTNINPNKAAHIGHLRNAVLGDILVRTLRQLGHPVEIQNYIDDTGVQLADVVVGFLDIRGLDLDAVAALPEPFDYYCWDLYSEVGRWYEEDESRRAQRRATLHALEHDDGERAEMGKLVARRIVRRHLETMARLGVGYDVLTREHDILALDFFTIAFEQLKETGAVRLEADGKNKGCWVMPLSESEEFAGLEDPDKVIVRSDGTVTYVGKDIAYQLWKFGLLGRDFQYRVWDADNDVWETTSEGGVDEHPSFGRGARVINVIDARQSYLQKIVRAGLEATGHPEEAKRSIHFAYEMVSLSAKTAKQLGYLDDDSDKRLEMSGRKGIGVKADDLLDTLETKSREDVGERYPALSTSETEELAHQIATGSLRFFMVKQTTTRVIAFDFDEALSSEGETGPYLQYALVRERNIRRKAADAGLEVDTPNDTVRALDESLWDDELWDIALAAASVQETVEKAADTLELSLLARHALDLAQRFAALYNKHRILGEDDADLRLVRLTAFTVFRRALEALTELLGVPVPDKM
ncbi:MAG: arginine--tRNA ligase [Acidobacteriota bacterium]